MDDAVAAEEDSEGVGREEGPVNWVRGAWGTCAGSCDQTRPGGPPMGWQHRQVS